jgi:hypothetical protein
VQLSFFSAQALPARPEDLAGLLAGPGQAVRIGRTARISVVVDEEWRVPVLIAAIADRGLRAESVAAVNDQPAVRTEFSATLYELAASWTRGAVKAPPAGFALDGPSLRLWALAAGQREGVAGYLLRLGDSGDGCAEAVGAALAAAGLAATLLGPRSGGPAYRITGRRRLRRMRELVGDPPPAVPAYGWPPEAWPSR